MKDGVFVMIVDDDPFIREVVSAALGARPGVRVRSFPGPTEALLAAAADAPDIIVLDYSIPGADGLTILSRFRAALASAPPVVFLTAQTDDALVARLYAAGAAGVLAKPFEPGAIAAAILRHGGPARAAPARDKRLDAIAANFRASLPQTMEAIGKEWSALRREWCRATAESIVMAVHKLAGAAGLFQLGELGVAARAAEAALLAQLDADARGAAVRLDAIEPAVAKLWDTAIAAIGET